MTEKTKANAVYDMGFVFLSIIGGLIIGIGFALVDQVIYLILLFPLVMGYLSGRVITDNAKFTKTNNKRLILISSVLTAIVLYTSFHYAGYLLLQPVTALQVFGDLSDQSLESGKIVVEYALKEATGLSGFLGYMLFKANEGVSIGRMFSSNRLNLGPILTWIYWLVEFGVITFITVKVGEQVMKRPFCEFCRSWYPEPGHVGGVPGNKETEVLDLIKRRDFGSAGKILEESPDVPSTDLYLQRCKSCDKSNSFLAVTNVNRLKGNLVFNEVAKVTLTPRENKLFIEEIRFLKIES